MYGVNTGIGELAEVVLTPEQVEKYQRYIVYSHAAGIGEPPAARRPSGPPCSAGSAVIATAIPECGSS